MGRKVLEEVEAQEKCEKGTTEFVDNSCLMFVKLVKYRRENLLIIFLGKQSAAKQPCNYFAFCADSELISQGETSSRERNEACSKILLCLLYSFITTQMRRA